MARWRPLGFIESGVTLAKSNAVLKNWGTMSDAIDLGIRGQKAHKCDHIAYFWESDEEFAEGVGFLETGLRQGDYCVIFGHPEANGRVLKILGDRGFGAPALEGRATVLGGKPVANDMLSEIGGTFQKAVEGGARLIRLLGNIGWEHPDWPAEHAIMEFEAQVTNACRNFPCLVVCMYDVRSLSGKIVVAAGLKTHPLTMCGGGLEENHHYVPAAQYLARYSKAS